MALSPYEIATLRASVRTIHKPDWIARAVAGPEIPPCIFRAGPDWAILYRGEVVALTPNLLIATATLSGEQNAPGYIPRILDPSVDPETVSDPELLAQRRRAAFNHTQAILASNSKRAHAEARRDKLFDLASMDLDALDRLSPLD